MTDVRSAALRYAENGWPVFPCIPRDKKPLTTAGFKEATTEPAVITKWFAQWPEANIAAVPGQFGCIVIDVDGPVGMESAAPLGILSAATLICRTGRTDGGHHRYFLRPEEPIGNLTLGNSLDVRCDAGYVMLPPSVHPSGERYRWEGKLRGIAPFPELALREIRRRSEAALIPPAPMVGVAERSSFGDTEKRVTAYLAKVGNRAEGEGRNNAAYQIGAWLTADMSVDETTAWAYLIEWNGRNSPPLGGRELRAVFMSAMRGAKHPKGAAHMLNWERDVARAQRYVA